MYFIQLKSLEHMISNDLSDDIDLQLEFRNIFVRTKILVRRFSRCSPLVKAVLFKVYCISIYDAALWIFYIAGSMHKLVSCLNKCVKIFFGYQRRNSMVLIIFDLDLPSLKTILVNSPTVFSRCYNSCSSSIVKHLYSLGC
jgi:hypothetical protein